MAQNKRTVVFPAGVYITGHAAVVGKKEGEGPLGHSFDEVSEDVFFGKASWEKAESEMQKRALALAMEKAGLGQSGIGAVFGGDLLNQCIGTSFDMRSFNAPFYGLYGACSTMALGMALGAMSIEGGFYDTAAAVTSSHFCSAERQYRFPLGYGGQRTPTAQWTATAAGAMVLSCRGEGPRITAHTPGIVRDMGITDANNMGAAMAPAAYDTLRTFFDDTLTRPSDYDLILTGDLGVCGSDILRDLFEREGMSLGDNYNDCGAMLYDVNAQDVHSGGSGCGCSAAVMCGHILNSMRAGKYKTVLFAATGALLSPTSCQQKESIPSISHAVLIKM